jgi:hypothetical protein
MNQWFGLRRFLPDKSEPLITKAHHSGLVTQGWSLKGWSLRAGHSRAAGQGGKALPRGRDIPPPGRASRARPGVGGRREPCVG